MDSAVTFPKQPQNHVESVEAWGFSPTDTAQPANGLQAWLILDSAQKKQPYNPKPKIRQRNPNVRSFRTAVHTSTKRGLYL